MSLVIIEGVDRTGKSTLAAELQERFGGPEKCELLHFGPPKATAYREYLDPLLDYIPGGGTSIVCDRFHVGELVWPGFFNRPPRITQTQRLAIDVLLVTLGAVVIYCHRDLEGLQQAFAEADPPEPLDVKKLPAAMQKFEELLGQSAVLVAGYEHKVTPIDAVVKVAEQAEEKAAARL